ncbi:hypothetical protein HGM15179_021534, partial [Zosterops borbonicus]
PSAPRSCQELSCAFGASCVEVNGFAHCECPSPLCAEANITKLLTRLCPALADPSAPRSCQELSCAFGASCVEVNGFAHCECPSPLCAEANITKVCGSDGVTYGDQCQLQTIACRQGQHITVKHLGQCHGQCHTECPQGCVTQCPLGSVTATILPLATVPVVVTTGQPGYAESGSAEGSGDQDLVTSGDQESSGAGSAGE